MDIVFIEGLSAETLIGVYDWEREIRQVVVLDLELGTDIRPAAATDDIAKALDYKTISDRLLALVEASEYQLLETMAEALAQVLQDEFNIPWLRLKLSKPGAVPAAANVGVLIERGSRC